MPSASPGNAKVTMVSTENITLTWNQLKLPDWNGEFLHFRLEYKSDLYSVDNGFESNTTSATIYWLHYGAEYRISIAFVGTGGVGPAFSISVLTLQDGR